jgi:hypothetical protein
VPTRRVLEAYSIPNDGVTSFTFMDDLTFSEIIDGSDDGYFPGRFNHARYCQS